MDTKLLVRVYRYISDNEVRIGTGYPVSPGRVLVARHVLADDDQEIDLARIVLTLYRHHQPDGSRTRVVASKVAWDGGGTTKWDAVLLECSFPQGFERFHPLSERRPCLNEVWQSEGFPQAGQLDDILEPQPLKGTTFACDEAATRFQLVADGAAISADGWRGVSGAPVFIGDRILGIITETREAFGGGRLWAVPTFRLLSIPEFCEALGKPTRTAIDRARYATKIEKLFLSAPAVIERVERNRTAILSERGIQLNIHRANGLSGDHARADILARTLVFGNLSPEDTRDILVGAIQECAAGEKEEQVLLEIIYWSLPICFNIQESETVRWHYERGKHLIDIPASEPLTAELMMAAADERRAVIERDRQGNLLGKYKIPGTPPLGLETTQKEELLRAAEDHAITVYGTETPNRRPSRKIINSVLKRNKGREKLYFLFDIAANGTSHDRDQIERLAQEIRTELPWIAVLLLSCDQDVVDGDFFFLSNIRDVLKRG